MYAPFFALETTPSYVLAAVIAKSSIGMFLQVASFENFVATMARFVQLCDFLLEISSWVIRNFLFGRINVHYYNLMVIDIFFFGLGECCEI